MAYQAKRKQTYVEDLELTEEDGTVVHTIHVALDPDSVVKKLSQKQIDLTRAMNDLGGAKKDTAAADKLVILGKAVTDLFEAVFGPEDAQTVIEFYGGRYIEMCKEVLPFVTGEVIPQVRKIAQENKKQVMQSYDRKPHHLSGRR